MSLQRKALRVLEDEIGGHQSGGERPAGEVVDGFGAMVERVEQA
jgi:hypothetical protein